MSSCTAAAAPGLLSDIACARSAGAASTAAYAATSPWAGLTGLPPLCPVT